MFKNNFTKSEQWILVTSFVIFIIICALFVYTYTHGIENYSDETEYNSIKRNSFANYFELNMRNLTIMNW